MPATEFSPVRPETPLEQRLLAHGFFWGGLLVLLLASVGLAAGEEPFRTWYYNFAWWSWIAIVDGAIFLRTGSSLLLSRSRAFFCLLPWSVAFWLFFEGANFFLQNWYYVGLPHSLLSRVAGIGLSFATVLPGVLLTAELLRVMGFARGVRCPRFVLDRRQLAWVTQAGAWFLVLPLILPTYFFPLIWGATTLLIEPWLYAHKHRSLLGYLARGTPGPILRLLAGGLVCGVLWEGWNFWARAKWIYTVPFLEELKLFEMPLLGMLGFPVFALECYTFARLLVALGLCPEFEAESCAETPILGADSARRRQGLGALGATLASVPLAAGVLVFTVHSTIPQVSDLDGVSPELEEALAAEGVREASELLEALHSEEPPAPLTDVGASQLASWIDACELMGVAGLGARGRLWLESVGVHTIPQLDSADILYPRLAAEGEGPFPPPTAAEVRVWVRRAQAHPRWKVARSLEERARKALPAEL